MKGALALVVAALGALFVPSWAVQLVCLLTLAATGLSFVYSILTRRAILVERDAAEIKAYARASVDVAVSVRNGSVLPLPYLSIRDRTGGLRALGPTETIVSLGPRGSARLTYTLKTTDRGAHELGPVRIGSTDPLGLFPWEMIVECCSRVIVYPPLGIVRTRIDSGLAGGDMRVPDAAFEDSSRLRDVREYVPGDDPRRIHWKASARLGALLTIQYESAISVPCLVILDLRLERYPLRLRYHYVERAVETAATLVATASRARQATALCVTAETGSPPLIVPFGRGLQHAIHQMSILACVRPIETGADPVETALAGGLRVPSSGRLCLVGAPPDPATVERASSGGTARVEVYQVGAGRAGEPAAHRRGTRVYDVRTYGEELAGD